MIKTVEQNLIRNIALIMSLSGDPRPLSDLSVEAARRMHAGSKEREDLQKDLGEVKHEILSKGFVEGTVVTLKAYSKNELDKEKGKVDYESIAKTLGYTTKENVFAGPEGERIFKRLATMEKTNMNYESYMMAGENKEFILKKFKDRGLDADLEIAEDSFEPGMYRDYHVTSDHKKYTLVYPLLPAVILTLKE